MTGRRSIETQWNGPHAHTQSITDLTAANILPAPSSQPFSSYPTLMTKESPFVSVPFNVDTPLDVEHPTHFFLRIPLLGGSWFKLSQ